MSQFHTQEQLGVCAYCSGVFENLSRDHIIPRSKLTIEQRESTFCIDNVVGACIDCNNLKHSDDLIIFLAKGASNVRRYLNRQKIKIMVEDYYSFENVKLDLEF
jgi:5-methylcytosine-specific restriction endonuclease McrA